ncbi:MAG: PatA/PatG family cyanobactin maturation protease [Bradyrhizobium sp.]
MHNAEAYANLGQGDDRICIAVLDGPVDTTHPCLAGAHLTVVNALLPPGEGGGAALAHGTHVASIIFGQPGSDVEGVAPRCRGLFIPVFASDRRNDHLGCSQLDLARAILLAAENGAHVINISGGELTRSGEPAPVLAQAIETCARRNILIVAAAGNDGCDCLHVPAAARSVLAVGAMDPSGAPLSSSNWGEAYRTQGILAPGADVLGAVPGGGITRKSGTSFAAPFVSGLVGLLASRQVARGESPNPQAIRAAILQNATPCVPADSTDCRRSLAGVLDIDAAIKAMTEGDDAMTEDTTEFGGTQSSLQETFVPVQAEAGTERAGGGVHMSEDVPSSAAPDLLAPSALATRGVAPVRPMPRGGGVVPSCGGGKCSCGGGGGGGGGGCGCGGGQQAPALVFALGQLDYEFASEARRDTFIQHMPAGANQPELHANMIAYLRSSEFQFEAASLTWLLKLDQTPIYAIQPAGPFANQIYEFLVSTLSDQLPKQNDPDAVVELVSVPGIIAGSMRLRSGQVVPVVVPRALGMFAWSSKALVERVMGPRPDEAAARSAFDAQTQSIRTFIFRVYYDLRNLGITGEDRALNFSATNLVQSLEAHKRVTSEYELDTICVERSPICRVDSECYDVKLCFFNPKNVLESDQVIKLTVDVTDSMPVSIGPARGWAQRDCRPR